MMRFAVFVSGAGSNLQALIDACGGSNDADIGVVLSNTTTAGALDRATRAGIATETLIDPANGSAIVTTLTRHTIDMVVLAGYLKRVPPEVVSAYEGRMINIHPALLPSFGGPGMYGSNVHAAVLESGATVSGATVHLVSPEYDRGRILAQWPVPVMVDDTPAHLAARVLDVEHRLLPAVVLMAATTGSFQRLPFQTASFTLGELPANVLSALPDRGDPTTT